MSGERPGIALLGRGIAAVLRTGTLVAVGTIGIGYLVGRIGGEGLTIVATGLLSLTLVPVVVLGVAVVAFARTGERGRLLAAVVVLALLGASLVTAGVLAGTG